MTTVSGFPKKELFHELENLLLTCHADNKDPVVWEKAIRLVAETICTPRCVVSLLTFFTDFVAKHVYVYDIHVWTSVVYYMKMMARIYERKKDADRRAFCHYGAKLFGICAVCPKKTHADFFRKVAYLEYVKPQIESLLYEQWIVQSAERYIHPYRSEVTSMGRHKLCVLLYVLERKNKILVYALLHDLLSPASSYIQSNGVVSPEKDMLWFVWDVFIKYATWRIKDEKWSKWLKGMSSLCRFQYNKERRKHRIQLLVFAMRVFIDGEEHDKQGLMSKINYAAVGLERDMCSAVDEIIDRVSSVPKTTHQGEHAKRSHVRKNKTKNAPDDDQDDELPEYLNFIPLKMTA